MPTPGPVAYQPHEGSLTDFVISSGFDQVSPSSLERDTQTVRVPNPFFALMADSLSRPSLCVISSQITPVSSSSTAQGLPQVFVPSFQIVRCRLQVTPLSAERFNSRSMSPLSARPSFRPSQNASSVPFFETISAGIRYVGYPSAPPTNTSVCIKVAASSAPTLPANAAANNRTR